MSSDSTARAQATSRAVSPALSLARPSGQPGRWLWMAITSGTPCAATRATSSASRRCPWIRSAAKARATRPTAAARTARSCAREARLIARAGAANACPSGHGYSMRAIAGVR